MSTAGDVSGGDRLAQLLLTVRHRGELRYDETYKATYHLCTSGRLAVVTEVLTQYFQRKIAEIEASDIGALTRGLAEYREICGMVSDVMLYYDRRSQLKSASLGLSLLLRDCLLREDAASPLDAYVRFVEGAEFDAGVYRLTAAIEDTFTIPELFPAARDFNHVASSLFGDEIWDRIFSKAYGSYLRTKWSGEDIPSNLHVGIRSVASPRITNSSCSYVPLEGVKRSLELFSNELDVIGGLAESAHPNVLLRTAMMNAWQECFCDPETTSQLVHQVDWERLLLGTPTGYSRGGLLPLRTKQRSLSIWHTSKIRRRRQVLMRLAAEEQLVDRNEGTVKRIASVESFQSYPDDVPRALDETAVPPRTPLCVSPASSARSSDEMVRVKTTRATLSMSSDQEIFKMLIKWFLNCPQAWLVLTERLSEVLCASVLPHIIGHVALRDLRDARQNIQFLRSKMRYIHNSIDQLVQCCPSVVAYSAFIQMCCDKYMSTPPGSNKIVNLVISYIVNSAVVDYQPNGRSAEQVDDEAESGETLFNEFYGLIDDKSQLWLSFVEILVALECEEGLINSMNRPNARLLISPVVHMINHGMEPKSSVPESPTSLRPPPIHCHFSVSDDVHFKCVELSKSLHRTAVVTSNVCLPPQFQKLAQTIKPAAGKMIQWMLNGGLCEFVVNVKRKAHFLRRQRVVVCTTGAGIILDLLCEPDSHVMDQQSGALHLEIIQERLGLVDDRHHLVHKFVHELVDKDLVEAHGGQYALGEVFRYSLYSSGRRRSSVPQPSLQTCRRLLEDPGKKLLFERPAPKQQKQSSSTSSSGGSQSPKPLPADEPQPVDVHFLDCKIVKFFKENSTRWISENEVLFSLAVARPLPGLSLVLLANRIQSLVEKDIIANREGFYKYT